MRRSGLALIGLLFLAACGGPAEPRWASDEAVREARFSTGTPGTITIFTMTSTRNGSGLHSAMMIDASERVIFDPAGTFQLPFAPERNDVHHGIDERALSVYLDYYARETINVNMQEIQLTPEQAERVLELAKSYGAVPKAQCTLSITRILREAGVGPLPVTFFPKSLMNSVDRLPGVEREVLSDTDADKNHGVLIQAVADRNAELQNN